jgi:hypothetical protein
MISNEANNILIQIENISCHINDLNKRLCSLERGNKDFTLCGFCNERMPSNSLHSCSVIRNIKDKIDLSLREIQHAFDLKLKSYDEELRRTIYNVSVLEEYIKKNNTVNDTLLFWFTEASRWKHEAEKLKIKLAEIDHTHSIPASCL